jgi:hypothetical protein
MCGVASDTVIISLETNPPQIDLPAALTICEGDKVLLDPKVTGVHYLWNDGSVLQQLLIDTAGTYALSITNGCGSDEANVVVSDGGMWPTVSLGTGISICPRSSVEVEPIVSNVDEWLWHDGSTLPTIIISNPGLIHLTVSKLGGSASDSVMVEEPVYLRRWTSVRFEVACDGKFIILHSNVTGVDYLWQDGSTNPFL